MVIKLEWNSTLLVLYGAPAFTWVTVSSNGAVLEVDVTVVDKIIEDVHALYGIDVYDF